MEAPNDNARGVIEDFVFCIENISTFLLLSYFILVECALKLFTCVEMLNLQGTDELKLFLAAALAFNHSQREERILAEHQNLAEHKVWMIPIILLYCQDPAPRSASAPIQNLGSAEVFSCAFGAR